MLDGPRKDRMGKTHYTVTTGNIGTVDAGLIQSVATSAKPTVAREILTTHPL